ncbi:SDR family NAD(P)-dependent oxidoreductase [Patulibacter americanus]|uniref:SDR family NAD(P)-dependent oxidoreductase n=1 Tax=Patulibacter americanus TaxID=588672 RepID=UPI0003B4BAB1|nr:SDR family NAD(P)-dependent oxidoreductase [Patulibacter americanus]
MLRRTPSLRDLAGRRVLITGAARGIGAALARDLAGRGARVALVGLEEERLAALAAELDAAGAPDAAGALDASGAPDVAPTTADAAVGAASAPRGAGRHAWFVADVRDLGAVRAAVAGTVQRFGGLDVVVANAGIVNLGTVAGSETEDLLRTIDVNLQGVVRTVGAALDPIVAARGHVLVVSSASALGPTAGMAAYTASKAGVEAFADALSQELRPTGATVGCAYLSWVDTDLVRDVDELMPSLALLRRRLPWPLRATTTPERAAAALAAGLAARSRRTMVPAGLGLLRWTRPVLTSRAGETAMGVLGHRLIPRMDRESRALRRRFGRNTPD